MIAIDCPFCSGEAQVEATLDSMTCEGCGVTVEVVPEPLAGLEAAA
jgi:hypothetical protein